MNIHQFKKLPQVEWEVDAYSRYYKHEDYLLEWIYVEDDREIIYLMSAFEKIQNVNIPNVVKYYDIKYNQQDKVVEVLRKYYPTKLLDYQPINKQTILKVTQQLFQTLSTLEGCGITLLSLKPTNIFYDGTTLVVGGFVRSDKFLLSQPMYQTINLRTFVKECSNNQSYNVTMKYPNPSYAMCFTSLIILIQFILQVECEQIGNVIKWMDQCEETFKSVPKTEQLLMNIESKFNAMRVFIEQSRQLLIFELCAPQHECALQLMALSTDLHIDNNIILFGDVYQFKNTDPQQQQQPKPLTQTVNKQPQAPPQSQQQTRIKKQSTRCGGGFALPKKK